MHKGNNDNTGFIQIKKSIKRIILLAILTLGITVLTETTPVGNAEASIKAPVKQSIHMSRYCNYLNVGDEYKFTAETIGTKEKILWSVSDTSIVSISKEGKVKALKNGYVTVYADAGKLNASCVVTIGNNRLGTFSKTISCYSKKTIWIAAIDPIAGEKLTASIDDTKVIGYSWGKGWKDGKKSLTLLPKATGHATITISSDKTSDKLIININVEKKPAQKSVLSADKIYEKCRPATVELSSTNDYGVSMGSGFFIDNGIIITNYHVIEGTTKIIAKTYNNKEYTVTDILGYNKELDLAVLKIKSKNTSLSVAQNPMKVGEDVYAIGSPFGLTGTMSKGMLSTVSRVIDHVDYIQFDAAISKGNSGGPLIDEFGEVIGINTMYYRNGQNLNFAINVNEVQKINTNHPMKISDYHAKYVSDTQKEFQNTMIHEDVAKSQSLATCQSISSDVFVDGVLTTTEDGDFYTITMSESGWFTIDIEYLNPVDADTQYIDFKVFNQLLQLKGIAVPTEINHKDYLACYLPVGQYYIALIKNNGLPVVDVNYLFTTKQIYDVY